MVLLYRNLRPTSGINLSILEAGMSFDDDLAASNSLWVHDEQGGGGDPVESLNRSGGFS
jgi:hypothetical protein